MNNISFGQYYPGNSWIYKMDPRMKIFLTIFFIVLIFLIPDLFGMLIALGVFFILFLTTRIPLIKVLNGLKGIVMLLLFTLILQLIYTVDTEVTPLVVVPMSIGLFPILLIVASIFMYFFLKKFIKFKTTLFLIILFLCFMFMWDKPFNQFNWNFSLNFYSWNWNIYSIGVNKAVFIFLRIILMILITSILTLTTMSTDINNGLEWLLSPLKLIKVPVSIFSMLISLTLRFIPTLVIETRKIMNAQASRGVDYKSGNLFTKARQIISLLIPMFVVSFKRADELSNAMEARGYIVGGKRTKLDREGNNKWKTASEVVTSRLLCSVFVICT
jgi:energy-coupling factor transport system permease protein